jgi:Fe-S-cluster containining protein
MPIRLAECRKCGSKCCKYFALEIDKPADEEELDDVRWYLCHQGASVFVEEGKWYLELQNMCKYLQPGGGCAIYEKRPRICADYGVDSDGDVNCHISGAPFDYEYEFGSLEEFEEYIEKVWKKAKAKKRRRASKAGREQGQTPR